MSKNLSIRSAILVIVLAVFASSASVSSVSANDTGKSSTQSTHTIGDDGLHKQSWFEITFRDIAEDMQEAAAKGKRLAIVFEQIGCSYCRKMHEEFLADPEVSDYIKTNFNIVQYNLFGSEEVTDLDGETLTEKGAAHKWGVMFTPTIIFLPESLPAQATDVVGAAVAAMPGSFEKRMFLHMFQWVREKGYNSSEHFQQYHARKLRDSN